MAIRQLAGSRVSLTLLAPDEKFAYRPIPTARPYAPGSRRELSLDEVTRELDASRVADEVALVDEERGELLTRSGETLHFDRLLIAVGARLAEPPGAAIGWHQDGRGAGAFARLLDDLRSGQAPGAGFLVPPDAGWPVSAYELALTASAAARAAGRHPDLFLATAEEAPLGVLGAEVSEAVAARLAAADVDLITGASLVPPPPPERERGADALTLMFRRKAPARASARLEWSGGSRKLGDERVIGLPAVHGRFLSGLPHDAHGFLPVDEHARVRGVQNVWAAGDTTSVELKHSLVAAVQASSAARSIAASVGAQVDEEPWDPFLHGIFLDGPALQPAELGAPDDPVITTLWWPPGRVSGAALSRFLAARDRAVKAGLGWHPRGLPTAAPLRQGRGGDGWRHPHLDADELDVDAARRSAQALSRAERRSRAAAASAGEALDAFSRREREVVARLEAAGYLSQ